MLQPTSDTFGRTAVKGLAFGNLKTPIRPNVALKYIEMAYAKPNQQTMTFIEDGIRNAKLYNSPDAYVCMCSYNNGIDFICGNNALEHKGQYKYPDICVDFRKVWQMI